MNSNKIYIDLMLGRGNIYHNIAKFSIAFYSDFYNSQKIFVEILHILLYNRLKCF